MVQGWTGWNCGQDVNECQMTPKEGRNNATCHNTEGGYTCSCLSGWSGDNCTSDVDECDKHVGKNNATCTNTVGGYKCRCTKGWRGRTCEEDIDEFFSHNPCLNHVHCRNIDGARLDGLELWPGCKRMSNDSESVSK
ncbi:Protocadherin Fat 4 [Mizuhopecten yessoensis]|uniref:Protocadherin Fat 4 n=1 Tax=Mizuhopecten yessoensis TaxID=6573 RepID=A0A210R5B2_MIZYE|nr:Protocadherin Fat 4 [Mizuhopecten yessoensis]